MSFFYAFVRKSHLYYSNVSRKVGMLLYHYCNLLDCNHIEFFQVCHQLGRLKREKNVCIFSMSTPLEQSKSVDLVRTVGKNLSNLLEQTEFELITVELITVSQKND